MPGSDGTLYNQGYKSWDWAVNQPFQTTLTSLAHNPDNIWGSAPSFHNYWAATFVFFALRKNVRWCWRTPMLVLGTLISISTLVLHQHNLADIAITYTMLGLVLIWQNYRNFDLRFEQWWDKLFKVK
jgi:membrane-associated phospholipid phosphatase